MTFKLLRILNRCWKKLNKVCWTNFALKFNAGFRHKVNIFHCCIWSKYFSMKNQIFSIHSYRKGWECFLIFRVKLGLSLQIITFQEASPCPQAGPSLSSVLEWEGWEGGIDTGKKSNVEMKLAILCVLYPWPWLPVSIFIPFHIRPRLRPSHQPHLSPGAGSGLAAIKTQ